VQTFADFWISVPFRPSALGILLLDIRARVGFVLEIGLVDIGG
jgi:hypothetical protein